MIANIAFIIYMMIKGKPKLKEQIKEAKANREKQEEKEREEEEERKRQRKKEEDEFSSNKLLLISIELPDETNNVSADINNTTNL